MDPLVGKFMDVCPIAGQSYQCKVERDDGSGTYLGYFLVVAVSRSYVTTQWYFSITPNHDYALPESVIASVPLTRRQGYLLSTYQENWSTDEFARLAIRPVIDISQPYCELNTDCELVISGFYDPVGQTYLACRLVACATPLECSRGRHVDTAQ